MKKILSQPDFLARKIRLRNIEHVFFGDLLKIYRCGDRIRPQKQFERRILNVAGCDKKIIDAVHHVINIFDNATARIGGNSIFEFG